MKTVSDIDSELDCKQLQNGVLTFQYYACVLKFSLALLKSVEKGRMR